MNWKQFVKDTGLEAIPEISTKQPTLYALAGIIAFLATTSFLVLNIISGLWILAFFNGLLLLLLTSMLFLGRLKRYQAGLYIVLMLFSIYFATCCALLRNGMEYGIVLMMTITALLVRKKNVRHRLQAFHLLSLVIALYWAYNRKPLIPGLSWLRPVLTICLITIIVLCLLEFFKQQQDLYTKRLMDMNTQLSMENDSRQHILSLLAHDFRSPLNNLFLLLNGLEQGYVAEAEFKTHTTEMKKEVQNLLISLEEVLDWSKLLLKGFPYQPEYFEAGPLLHEVVSFFQKEVSSKQLYIHFNIDDVSTVYADRSQIKVCLRNLLSNAIKFTPVGGTITLSAQNANGHTEIILADSGKGMETEKLNNILSGSSVVPSDRGTNNEKGTGLGLFIVKELTRNNKGTLSMESVINSGTKAHIVLPESPTTAE
ncbi:MAG: HAMP domain-containing histidine kinase [Filimonas sp.]|nr:HAMP domain-containing histidine kinase [Filimonas sp.]